MENICIKHNVSELGEYKDEFNSKIIEEVNNILSEQLMGKTFDQAKEMFHYKEIDLNSDIYEPYRIEFVDIEMDEDRNTTINLKVKDIVGRNSPRLIPYGKIWYVCGLRGYDDKYHIDKCESLEDIAVIFENHYSDEFGFRYICVIDHNLEIVDWNSFYNWNDNQEMIDEIKSQVK